MLHRRHFLKSATAVSLAVPAFGWSGGCAQSARTNSTPVDLVPDPEGWLDLPDGFSYTRFSLTGEPMSDGFKTPGDHDGMSAFPIEGEPDKCLLIRNHEVGADEWEVSAFTETVDPVAQLNGAFYDKDDQGRPLGGGTTSLVYNLKTGQLEESWLSLAGTEKNCSGGPTPWGSWLTCEESRRDAGVDVEKDHGYIFEVPSTSKGLVAPVPLKDMGRFNHEAVAVDPSTGIVYETEDEHDGLFYRFLPNTPGTLQDGGRLQALALEDWSTADTRNWQDDGKIAVGQTLNVRWIDLEDVTAQETLLRKRGTALGAAIFARGEGMAWAFENGMGAIYFACTNGGPAKRGQIWRYEPAANEDANTAGTLTLHFESPGEATLDMCDNIVASPWGHLVICEDGDNEQFVRGLTPDGRIYPIARNANAEKNEFAGACFSPDGTTLFVNVQDPGATYAIIGPWATLYA